jgi:hypothetical protein
MDRLVLYDILFALVARDGRGEALFGDGGPAAREAFALSLVDHAFPELWFEFPLAGEPWLDFHALVSREDVAGARPAFCGQSGPCADALAWFAAQDVRQVRQLALSYDTSAGDTAHPAVQLLANGWDVSVAIGFLGAAGRADLGPAYRSFFERMPKGWYACYTGLFPRMAEGGRTDTAGSDWVRVECIVDHETQRTYASDTALLREHLAGLGMRNLPDGAADVIGRLARSPFPLELQFNVGADGVVLPAISASVHFQPRDWQNDARRGEIGRLAQWLVSLGLADGRCALLDDTVFAQRVTHAGKSVVLSCFPAFVKLRWRRGEAADAKSYLMARVEGDVW